MKTVLINSTTDMSYNRLFPSSEFKVVNGTEWISCGLLLLVGHITDVDPATYNADKIYECGAVDEMQDLMTLELIRRADHHGVPIIGICKGAQQLCVSRGGHLIQHVPRVGKHNVISKKRVMYEDVPADHHQVMVPPNTRECSVIMRNATTMYPDVVLWDHEGHTPDLAIQFHPEWALEGHAIRKWFDSFIKRHILE